jgi:hypothetical protein
MSQLLTDGQRTQPELMHAVREAVRELLRDDPGVREQLRQALAAASQWQGMVDQRMPPTSSQWDELRGLESPPPGPGPGRPAESAPGPAPGPPWPSWQTPPLSDAEAGRYVAFERAFHDRLQRYSFEEVDRMAERYARYDEIPPGLAGGGERVIAPHMRTADEAGIPVETGDEPGARTVAGDISSADASFLTDEALDRFVKLAASEPHHPAALIVRNILKLTALGSPANMLRAEKALLLQYLRPTGA